MTLVTKGIGLSGYGIMKSRLPGANRAAMYRSSNCNKRGQVHQVINYSLLRRCFYTSPGILRR